MKVKYSEETTTLEKLLTGDLFIYGEELFLVVAMPHDSSMISVFNVSLNRLTTLNSKTTITRKEGELIIY